MNKSEQARWFVKEIKSIDIKANPESKTKNWINQLANVKNIASEINTYKEELSEKHTLLEKEICDIYHYIEFFDKLSASQGYKAYKMLRDRLIARREVKDELEKIGYMLNTNIAGIANNQLEKSIMGLDNRQYEPRVLKELFANN